DCGLFQGLKRLRELNWATFPVDPASIEAVLLTHAHIDHSGYLPALVRDGFRGPIWCTPSTTALARILLRDAAYLQEEDARYANLRRSTRHDPAQVGVAGVLLLERSEEHTSELQSRENL